MTSNEIGITFFGLSTAWNIKVGNWGSLGTLQIALQRSLQHLSPGIGKLRAQCDDRAPHRENVFEQPAAWRSTGDLSYSFMCVATSKKGEACFAMICLLVRIYLIYLSGALIIINIWCICGYVMWWCQVVTTWVVFCLSMLGLGHHSSLYGFAEHMGVFIAWRGYPFFAGCLMDTWNILNYKMDDLGVPPWIGNHMQPPYGHP